MKVMKFNFEEVSPAKPWFHFTERVWTVWYFKVILSCCCSFAVGCTLVNFFRERCKKTNFQWQLARILFLIPLCIYLLLSWAAQNYLCDRVIADALSFGVVVGILYNLNSLPTGKSTIKLIAHQLDGRHESVWLDSMDATVGEAREKLAATLPGMETKLCLESGKGSWLEDMDAALLPLLNESQITRDFFGFTTVQCHISTREIDCTKDTHSDSRGRESGGKSSLMSFIGMSNKTFFGQNLILNAKVFSKKSDSRDVRALVIAPVDFNHTKFAAAAPSRGSMLDKIDGGQITVRLLSWHSVKVGDVEVFSENEGPPSEGSSNTPSAKSSAKSGQSSPTMKRKDTQKGSSTGSPTPSMVSQVATKLLNRNLEFSLPIRNGEVVVVESDGKFMSVAKGWWMAWFSTTPRRSGAFKIEILERGEGLEQQLGKGLKNIKDKMKNQISSKPNNNSNTINNNTSRELPNNTIAAAAEAPIEADAVLRLGDSFRLRSMKFPEYELGVTSDKIKDDYCYLGLRKVDEPSDGSEWCMPVRFSVKTTVFKG